MFHTVTDAPMDEIPQDSLWSEVETSEKFRLLGFVNEQRRGPPLILDKSVLEKRALPFLRQGFLYRVTDFDKIPSVEVRFLRIGETVSFLDGTNGPVYAAMADHGFPVLNRLAVASYLRFFFEHVTGRHSGFRIVERPADILYTGIATPADKARVESLLRPVALILGDEDRMVLSATMVFRSTLFAVKIDVHRSGRIRVFDEEPLLSDQPFVPRIHPR